MRRLSCFHSWAGAGVWRVAAALAVLFFTLTSSFSAEQFRAAYADVFHDGMQNAGQVTAMVTALKTGGYNAVVAQVLAYMDGPSASSNYTHGAYWQSTNVPWCHYTSSGFDPLTNLCQQAHANGIQVYAWLGGSCAGDYKVSLNWPLVGNTNTNISAGMLMVPLANSETGAAGFVDGKSTYYMLDMGSAEVQEYLVRIVRELVSKYPINGITWDDEHNAAEYSAGLGFPACATNAPHSGLARYRANTGFSGPITDPTDSAYGDYRRRFKNELMARCQAEIQSIKTFPERLPVRHTLTGMAYGNAPTSYNDFTNSAAWLYYSDWARMLSNGWIDAAMPMVYRREQDTTWAPDYRKWCDVCSSSLRFNRHIYVVQGAYLAKSGSVEGNSVTNNVTQLAYAYSTNLNGAATYSYAVPYGFTNEVRDWWGYVAANLYTATSSVPAMPWRTSTATEGMMWGRVKEAKTGLYLDDTTVTVTNGLSVQTDGNGYYVATLIPATTGGSVYSPTASKAGLASLTTNATVLPGDVVRYDFVLKGFTATALSPISPSSVCAGATVTLTATVTGTNGPTGSIEFFDGTNSLGTATLSGGLATKSVSSLSVGTHSSITANYLGDAQNSPSTSSPGSVTVNAIPSAPTAGNNGPVCVGSTLNLTASTVSGATYAWTGPNSFTSSAQNPSILNATTAATGTYNVKATVNGCISAAGTTTATVNPVPSAPTAGNNGPICAGSTLNLTASTISGATYAWTGPNSFTSSAQNPSVPNATTVATGTYSVTATVNGCTSAAGTTTATVNAVPSAPTAGNNGPICAGSTLNLTASTISGATYAWTGPNSFTSSVRNPSIPNATTAASGQYSVTATVNGCTSTAGTTTVTVTAIPSTPTASNSGPTCPGSTLNLTASPVSGATYAWTGPNGFTSSAQNPSIPNATAAAAGLYSVTATVNGCTSAAGWTSVTVITPPTIVLPPCYECASGTFRVTFAGLSNCTYTVQWAPSVTGSWAFLKCATSDANGLFEVVDTKQPPPCGRYYRITCP